MDMGTMEEILKPVDRYWQPLMIITGIAALFLLLIGGEDSGHGGQVDLPIFVCGHRIQN